MFSQIYKDGMRYLQLPTNPTDSSSTSVGSNSGNAPKLKNGGSSTSPTHHHHVTHAVSNSETTHYYETNNTSNDMEDSGASQPRVTPRKSRASSMLADDPVNNTLFNVDSSSNVASLGGLGGGGNGSAIERGVKGGEGMFSFMGGQFNTMKQHASDFNLSALADSMTDIQQRTAQQVQTRFPLLGGPFWACFFYSLVSTSMILVNKLILSTYHFRYPMVLLFHQNLMTVNSLYIAKELGITTYEPLDIKRVVRWLPMDIFFVIMLLTGFYSVQMLSVPMVTIFKNTNNIFIAVGDAIVYGNIPSAGVVYTMLLMLLAAVMAALNDLEFTAVGYLWTFANCMSSTAFVLYAQSAIAKTNLSTFGKVYYNNVLALPLVAIADFLVFGDFQRLLFDTEREEIISFLSLDFICLWFLSGILGFLQSLSSLKAQHMTSPTTYSMVGSLNKIPLTFLGVWIFHSPMTAKGVLYVSLSIIAGALYSYTKAKEDIAARAEKQQAQQKAQQQQQDQDRESQILMVDKDQARLGSLEESAHLRGQHRSKTNKSRSLPTPMVDAAQIVLTSSASIVAAGQQLQQQQQASQHVGK